MSPLLKNLIIALGITLLLGVVYYFTIGGSTPEDVIPQEYSNSEVAQQTDKILSDTQKINDFKIDTSILSDARFVSLQKTRIELPSVPTGRPNPFSSIR